MLVTRSWKYCTISENMKLKALKLTCHDEDGDANEENDKNRHDVNGGVIFVASLHVYRTYNTATIAVMTTTEKKLQKKTTMETVA